MKDKEDSEVDRRSRRARSKATGPGGSEIDLTSFLAHVEAVVLNDLSVSDDKENHWRSGFVLVRKLLTHPVTERLPGKQVWAAVAEHLDEDVSDYLTRDDLEVMFFEAWEKVRLPEGADPLERALELAKLHPLTLKPEILQARPGRYAVFISMAGWLAVVLDTTAIKLPVEAVARVMGLGRPSTVSTLRRMAQEDGYLQELEPHRYCPGGQGEATTFKFAVEKFPCLCEAMYVPAKR